MNKVNCEIIKDILPLYIDDVCSNESRELVEEHIKKCSECNRELNLMKDEEYIPSSDSISENNKASEIVKKVNKKIIHNQIITAALTAIVVAAVLIYFFKLETFNPYNNPFVTEINCVEDIMHYFKYAFFPYIVLFIVVIFNLYKSIFTKKNNEYSGKGLFNIIDLVIDVFCGLAMASGLMFLGVLADNNAPDYMMWGNLLIVISVVSFIAFIVNLIMVIKVGSKK